MIHTARRQKILLASLQSLLSHGLNSAFTPRVLVLADYYSVSVLP